MKLLASKLPKETKERLEGAARNSEGFAFHPHLMQRLQEKGIRPEEVRSAIKAGSLVEAHDEAGTRRLLVRDPRGVCVVIDLDVKMLITTYRNDPCDSHRTLNVRAYFQGMLTPTMLRKWQVV